MRWGELVSVFLVMLLFVPVVLAGSTTCSGTYDVGESFPVTVESAGSIKVGIDIGPNGEIDQNYSSDSHVFSVSYGIPQSNLRIRGKYYDGTNWNNNGDCQVDIVVPNSLGSISASPSSVTIPSGSSASFSVSASDADGINDIYLVGDGYALYQCERYGIYPATCSGTMSVSFSNPGSFHLTPRVTDKWGNQVDGTPVSVTVTDPCATMNCNDGKECTTDSCNNGVCVYTPKLDGTVCSSGKCEGGVCLPLCVHGGGTCYETRPTNSQLILDHYCEDQNPICAVCPSSFPIYDPGSNACIAGSTCSLGETQCQFFLKQPRMRTCIDMGGYYDWGAWTNCEKGEVCIGTMCGLPTADTCSYGGTTYSIGQTRCDGSVLFTCIDSGGATWDAGNHCPEQCTGTGGAASCVECLDNSHCDDTNVCTADSCSGGTCVNTPITGVCTTGGGETGTCQNGQCVATGTPTFLLRMFPLGPKEVGESFNLVAQVENYVGSFWFQPMNESFTCDGNCLETISHQENAPDTYSYYLEDVQGGSYSPRSVIVSCPAGTTWDGTQCADNCVSTCTVLNSRQCVAGAQAVEECQQVQTCLQWTTIEYCHGTISNCDNGRCIECYDSNDCADPQPYCMNNICSALSISPSSIDLTEGDSTTPAIIINFAPGGGYDVTIEHDLSELLFTYPEFWMRAHREDVGRHTVKFTVSKNDLFVALVDMPIRVYCDSANECCEGDLFYQHNGELCTYNNDPNGGVCNADGACVENCINNAYRACYDDDIWYFDSCDNAQSLSLDCGETICTEVNGEPLCEAGTNCDNTPYHRCRGNTVQYVDECSRVTDVQTCAVTERCEEDNGDAACVRKGPCEDLPGTMWCRDVEQCIDILQDPNHCGGCGRECNLDQVCDDGGCLSIPNCKRVCGPAKQCGENEVCINPDHCFLSECQAVNVLEQNTSTLVSLSELLSEGLVQVNTSIDGNQFTYMVTNLAGTPLNNVSITSEFKKLIASSAQYLQVQGVNYSIIEDDPVLAFNIPVLENEATFTVTTPRTLSEQDMSLTTILGITYQDILSLWNATKDSLTIGLNSEFDGENTKFHLTLNPNKGLNGVSVPIEIPKCMAQYAADMQLQGKYTIIKDDPLIVWQFAELKKPTEITFSVKGDIDEECKAQLKAMALANHIGKPINPWFAVLLIPLIGTLLIFFQRFTPTPHEKLSKKEFLELAQGQGQTEEEALREWHDYKRRF